MKKQNEVRVKVSPENLELIRKWAKKFDSSMGNFALHVIMERIVYLETMCERSDKKCDKYNPE